ncbi:MarR family winged helix-turn-helix transcriptional regulator [Arthrobacter sp. H14-L1]|uniref:MarR family winged helix-turn-helix transcriptional regulator n=1 Tax=Arthrobacter sp. H14-L1 TaxID=2996697 RepID=UPI00226E2F05|nr:MarR family transcriptional regulator [Arthrobacter sp. H14-L1]MCY0904982.1 MarR family transcriptional regulator [Arthrobacter sp. H14-L1]
MSEPNWLSAQERQAWLALLSTMTLLPGALDGPLQQEAGLSLFDYNVLAMLSEATDRTLPMSELAARTSASLSRLSHVVKKLEGRNYVTRCTHARDARVTTATVTEPGMDLVTGLAPAHVHNVRTLVFDQLDDDDAADLARIGRKLVRGLDPQHWILREPAP